MYSDKYIKTKISLYNINIYGNKTPIEGKYYKCFSVILLDSSVFRRMQICRKKKIMSKIKEELKLDKSEDEPDDEFDKYQNM